MQINKSGAVALGTAIGGGLLYYYTVQTITDLPFDSLGASFFPKMVAVGMVLFGIVLFITSLREGKRAKETGYTFRETMKIGIFLVSLFLYAFLLPATGFLVSTTLLMLVMFLILTDRWRPASLAGALIFSLVSTCSLWLLFTKVFQLVLP